MKRNHYFVGILVALLLSVALSVPACTKETVPEQTTAPPVEEQPTEEPSAKEYLTMEAAIKAALTTFSEAKAVSARFADPLLGSPVYLIELSNGMEVKVDAQTGKVLGSEKVSDPSPAAALLSQITVSLEEAVTAVLETNPNRTAVEAKLMIEADANMFYVIKLDNGEEVKVDAA